MKIDQRDVPMPKFGKTALELLDARNAEPPSVASAYGVQFSCGIIGAFAHVMTNWTYRRPMRAGNVFSIQSFYDNSNGFFVHQNMIFILTIFLHVQVLICIQFILRVDTSLANCGETIKKHIGLIVMP